MLPTSLRLFFRGIILLIFFLKTTLTPAQTTDTTLEKERIDLVLDSIFNLPEQYRQFTALTDLFHRNTWRMNPFTVQYLNDHLGDLQAGHPLIPALTNFLFGEFLNVNLQQFNKSLFFYQKARAELPASERELELRIWERISAISLSFSKLENAIPATDSCIVLAQEQREWFTLAHCLKCKGDIRRIYFQEAPGEISAYQEALFNYKLSFQANRQQKDTLAALLNLFFITSIYLDIDSSHQQAGAYIDTAFSLIAPIQKYDDFRAQNHFLRGKLLSERGEDQVALKEFTEAFGQFAVTKDTARLAQLGLLVGEIHFRQGAYRIAIDHLKQALELSPKVNSLEQERDIHKLLYQNYKALGDYEMALTEQEAYNEAKDKINKLDQVHLRSAMEIERGLQAKQKEIDQQEAELSRRDLINRFLLAGTLLLLVLVGLLLGSFIRIRKDRNTLAERNAIIEAQKGKLEELDGIKSRFFANISHELRTPLTLILAPLKRLSEKFKAGREASELLETAQKNTLHLYQLVDELLDFSKIESGTVHLELQPLDLDHVLQQLYSGFLPLADTKHIHLRYHREEEEHAVVIADQNALKKILNNLLGNALKFSPENSEVQLMRSTKAEEVWVEVIDNGPGIYADDLPHIFDRFYQSRHKDVVSDHSTGLGLALSVELANLMNGRLWVESERGVGSRFCLVLPAAIAALEPGARLPTAGHLPLIKTEQAVPHEAPLPANSSSVLIVEDHEDLRQYLAALLGEDYQVFTAGNGQEALELLCSHHHPLLVPGRGLIISDMMMPVLDGLEFLQALKGDDRFAGLPVIMLTALKNHADRLKALTIGVDDYLVKPFDNQELLIRVRNLLHRSWERSNYASPEPEEGESFFVETHLVPDASQLEWLKDLETFSLKNISNSQFGVGFLSSYANMSERNFQRHIKKATGMTPSEYIKELRLHQARELLESGQIDSVKAVSKAVGFTDQEYFSTVFQSRFGRRPSTYLAR